MRIIQNASISLRQIPYQKINIAKTCFDFHFS